MPFWCFDLLRIGSKNDFFHLNINQTRQKWVLHHSSQFRVPFSYWAFKYNHSFSEEYYLSIVYLLERLLGSHAWMSSDTHDKRIIDPPCEGQDSISQDAMRHLMDQIVNVLPRVRINITNVVRHIDDPEDDLFTGSQEACKKWISERILEMNKLITLDNKKAPKMKTQIPLLMKDDFKTMKQHQIASEGNGWNIPKLCRNLCSY